MTLPTVWPHSGEADKWGLTEREAFIGPISIERVYGRQDKPPIFLQAVEELVSKDHGSLAFFPILKRLALTSSTLCLFQIIASTSKVFLQVACTRGPQYEFSKSIYVGPSLHFVQGSALQFTETNAFSF